MSLLTVLYNTLKLWQPAFSRSQSFYRAIQHALVALSLCGRRTITQTIIALNRDQQDWSADYKLYSKHKWEVKDLFQPIIEKTLPFATGKFIHIAVDDTKLRKTGKKITSASWQRDPMGPSFQTNLVWAQRFLHFSFLVPMYDVFKSKDTPPRSLPIRFIDAPSVKKPGKRATKEQIEIYKLESKERNLSTLFLRETQKIRDALDLAGAKDKTALVVADGSFCNRTCMNINIARIEMVARCRKDAKLCFAAVNEPRRFYSQKKFSPEQVRQNETISWKTEKIFHGGRWRDVYYKEIRNVLWQRGTKKKPLRLIVLRSVKYHVTKTGKAYYRQPAYLLSTELESPIKELIQAYFDRWQIEVNHREQKSIIGVGQAQVRNEESVHRQPAFLVAAYSALLLSSILAYADQLNDQTMASIPKWYRTAKRPSCRQLVSQLRRELLEYQEHNPNQENVIDIKSLVLKMAA
ncbi:transposase [Sulfobacillus acidophilus]|uniref:Transposase n=1 Tax=Sulfobacillus acidophilus TaxID=53633 RepID=A0ABS3AX18_9FIRM|nr:transposase [Sulfobacillus acidophilus]